MNAKSETEPLKQKPAEENGAALTEACEDDRSTDTGPPIPPDGGYGWVIVCASFTVSFLVDGVCFSFGIFFIEFLDQFQESKEQTSWVGSVLNGMYLSMGPIVGALANKFGCRKVAITGSVMVAVSLILSTFSNNIYLLILTYGVMTGMGFGLMYLPAIVMVGYYFEKRRALATGIAVCGSGIGGFVFAPMCEKLIEIYAWRGATWIIAGICLNGMVIGALFRPLESPHNKRQKRHCIGDSNTSGTEQAKQISNVNPVVHGPKSPTEPKDMLKFKLKHSFTSEEVKSEVDYCSVSLHNLSPENLEPFAQNSSNSRSCDDLRLRCKHPVTAEQESEDLKRPMYRKDIFYGGSVQNLPQYKESENVETYVRSITSVPEKETSSDNNESCSAIKNACKSLTDTLKEMMDLTLLRNPVFCIYGFSCFLCMAGFFVPFIYLPDLAISYDLSRKEAAFLISIIGIANTVARVACGWVSDQPWADCLVINNCALVIGGVATMLCPFCTTYGLLGTYSFVFGSCIAAFVSLRSIIMVDLMGLEKLTNAFGLVTLCQGLSSFIGAPIAGVLYDKTGSYDISFYVAGAMLSTAGLICFPLRRIALWRKKALLREGRMNNTSKATQANILEFDNNKCPVSETV